MRYRYFIEEISTSLTDDFLKRHHYLSQQGNGFLSKVRYGLFREDKKFVGVITFSGISVIETLIGAFDGFDKQSQQDGFWELSRLSMDDDTKERNLTSWFVSHSIQRLRKTYQVRAIISYADSRYHHGYIYQATNFKYYGMTAPKADFYENIAGIERQVWRGKVSGLKGEWKERPRKHRYMIVYDKSLKVRWTEEPFPKGDNTEYELKEPKVYQLNIFDYV